MSRVVCFSGEDRLLRLIGDTYIGVFPIVDMGVLPKSMGVLGIKPTDENRTDLLKAQLPGLLKSPVVIVLGVRSDDDVGVVESIAGADAAIGVYDVGHADEVHIDIVGFILTQVARITHVNNTTFLQAVDRAVKR